MCMFSDWAFFSKWNQMQVGAIWRVQYGFVQSGTGSGSFSGYRVSYRLSTERKLDS